MSPAIDTPRPAALRPLRRVARSLAFVGALCLAIALLLATLQGGFRSKLIYSLAIGLSCWALTDGLRISVNAWLARRGLARLELRWGGMLPLLLLGVLLGPAIGLAIGDALTGHTSASLLAWDSPNTRVTLALALIGSLAATFVMRLMERLALSRAEAEAAQRLAAESRLALLQAQLEPHMLFNTLANLRVLIGIDAAAAQQMLDRLIAFLRATLAASRQAQHSLADEFASVADYLALMSLRMGPRLAVQLDLPPALRDATLPTLLLQPLVENSIRHGLEPQVGAVRIEVRAAQHGTDLELTVLDSGVGLPPSSAAAPAAPDAPGAPDAAGGFGLPQVRARLATLYGDRAGLELLPAPGGGTLARVRLPLQRQQAVAR